MKASLVLTLLSQRQLTGGQLAKKIGVHRSLVYRAIAGAGSRPVRVRIAALLQQSPSILWSGVLSRDQVLLDDVHYNDFLRSGDSVRLSNH